MERDAVWAGSSDRRPLPALLDQPSRTAEERGTLVEPSRFGTLARRVFSPLLTVEELREPLRSTGGVPAGRRTTTGRGRSTSAVRCRPGTTVLEASAGTGKTYTIAALAARYVAEGRVELPQLMIVTFGRMATDELRVRVRERLVLLEAQLAETLGLTPPGVTVPPADPIAELLLDVDTEELARRHERVSRALADFDAATIATTHEFCLRMLDDLGVLGDR